MLRKGAKEIVDFATGGDSPEDDLTKDFVQEFLGAVPFVGSFMSISIYGGEPIPVIDVPVKLVKGLTRAVRAKTGQGKIGGAIQTAGAVGRLAGIPGTTQVEQAVRGVLRKNKGGRTRGPSLKSARRRSFRR